MEESSDRKEKSGPSNKDASSSEIASELQNIQRMHSGILINSNQLQSAQGSVFFVKHRSNIQKELVLKIYDQDNMNSYYREKIILDRLSDLRKKDPSITGFPQIISKMESENQAEILMEALGPSLKKLVKQCPAEGLSLHSIYNLTI